MQRLMNIYGETASMSRSKKQQEFDRISAEQAFQVIAEHTNDLVAIIEKDGRILYGNKSLIEIVGKERAREVNDFVLLLHSADRQEVSSVIDKVFTKETHTGFTARMMDGTGVSRIIEFRAIVPPPSKQQGQYLILIGRDMTQQGHLESEK